MAAGQKHPCPIITSTPQDAPQAPYSPFTTAALYFPLYVGKCWLFGLIWAWEVLPKLPAFQTFPLVGLWTSAGSACYSSLSVALCFVTFPKVTQKHFRQAGAYQKCLAPCGALQSEQISVCAGPVKIYFVSLYPVYK